MQAPELPGTYLSKVNALYVVLLLIKWYDYILYILIYKHVDLCEGPGVVPVGARAFCELGGACIMCS